MQLPDAENRRPRRAAMGFLLLLLVATQWGCVSTRPSEILQVVEIEIKQTPTPVGDQVT